MEKLVIIDYSDTSVHFYDVDTEDSIDIKKLGYKESQCSWMFGENIDITFHKKIVK